MVDWLWRGHHWLGVYDLIPVHSLSHRAEGFANPTEMTFTYPKKDVPVLQDMTFVIQPGQLCVIVGENGCGKVCGKYLSRYSLFKLTVVPLE